MLFNSFEFLIFLPIVFLLYWFAFHDRKSQNLLLVVASYVFYGWWDCKFLLLIAFTTLCCFVSGRLIERYEGKRIIQRWISGTNIVINLAILGIFKYYNFFLDSLERLIGQFGFQLDWVTLNVVLPVGISFYTFQALSYSIDVYQKKLPASRDAVEFFAYISFFPQLVAGPIERATNLLPQFQKSRQFDYTQAVDGCRQMLWGFLKKVVVADSCAMVVNEYWGKYAEMSGGSVLIVAMLFSFQIYGDFSGYSDIAIGCAKLFGFKLMRNFNYPYFSCSIPEFWRRWHISLTTWFRDYIFIPLGGSRCSQIKVIRNIIVVWAISGLWHGAKWTFVCWGLYHAILLVLYNLLNINTKSQDTDGTGKLPSLKRICYMSITYLLALGGWIIFRAGTMTQASEYIKAIFTNRWTDEVVGFGALMLCILLLIIEWVHKDRNYALESLSNQRTILRWGVYCFLYFFIAYFFLTLDKSDFIYFQF